jgi:ligand-binding sensor domain-containing protein/anti-sigma regulatory factor (Ser/Thr protein kinase)
MRILCWIGCFLASSLLAQDNLHVIHHYTRNNGLSNNHIECILEDSRGFLWIGTAEGLNRFDGSKFKSYFQNKNNPESLSHNKVYDILEYQEGLLLLATGNGISIFNIYSGEFENERIHYSILNSSQSPVVSSIYQDPEGNVWINHGGEIDILDKNLTFLYRISDQPWARDLKGCLIDREDWYMDRSGQLWLPTDTSGLQIVDIPHHTIYNKKNNPENLPFLNYKSIRSFLYDEENQIIWISPWGSGLQKFNLHDGSYGQQLFSLPMATEIASVNSLLKTEVGNLLTMASGQIVTVNADDLSYRPVTEIGSLYESPEPNSYGTTITRTRDNQYWVGTHKGLFHVVNPKNQFELFFGRETENSNCTEIILASTGKIYTLHDNNKLIETNQDRKSFQVYSFGKYKYSGGLTTLIENSDHTIWIGTTIGAIIFDPEKKTFERAHFPDPSLDRAYINVLFLDEDHYMWIGTRTPFHLYRFKHEDNSIQEMKDEVLNQYSALSYNSRFSSIVQDQEGKLWMTSFLGGGIVEFNPETEKWSLFPEREKKMNILSEKGITSLWPDDEGNLWITSIVGSGLIKYAYQTGKIETYGRENGILSDFIYSVLGDDNQNLWLTTEYGISVFNSQTQKISSEILFGQSNFDLVPLYDPNSKQLILALNDRLLMISTFLNTLPVQLPLPVIDGIYINNEKYILPEDKTQFKLHPIQKNITIDFTVPYFTNAQKLHFAYQLAGADDTWKSAGENRSAQYSLLRPGLYTFKIKTGDNQGNWSSTLNAFAFTIVPPFWKSPGFIFGAATFIAVAIFLMIRSRFRRIRYEGDLKQKITETEMMALRAQMNPHFIFNSLNSIDALIHSNDRYNATLYLNKFAKLIRNILDSSKLSTINISKDLENIQLYIDLEKLRSENKFTSEIIVDPDILNSEIRVPPLIIQPYVENAILHGLRNLPNENGHLLISIERRNEHLHYIIEDNGVGRKFERNGQHRGKMAHGMQISRDRIKLFNKEDEPSLKIIDLEKDGKAAGTRIEVQLNLA